MAFVRTALKLDRRGFACGCPHRRSGDVPSRHVARAEGLLGDFSVLSVKDAASQLSRGIRKRSPYELPNQEQLMRAAIFAAKTEITHMRTRQQ